MKRLPGKQEHETDLLVQRIWEEMVISMDQYTNDSALSKFYLPEDILTYCDQAAVIFTQLLYSPIPTKEEVTSTRLYGLIHLSMICGVQIFLKERNFTKGYLPYKINTAESAVREARNKVGRILSEGMKVKPPVSQVMDILITHLNTQNYIPRFALKDHEFNINKFENLHPAAIMWGYLLSAELVIDEENIDSKYEVLIKT